MVRILRAREGAGPTTLTQYAGSRLIVLVVLVVMLCLVGCRREPPLYLHTDEPIEVELPIIAVTLDTYWDYADLYDGQYDWTKEWYYGWDETDEQIFGHIGYEEPSIFQLRRYYTGDEQYGAHQTSLSAVVYGNLYEAKYNWGFWDILVWNDIQTSDGVQSLRFDESALEHVMASTGTTMATASFASTNSYYQPEELFAAYEYGIEVDEDMTDFIFDSDRNVWVKTLNMVLEPITYIYLVQVILHNNSGKITGVDGNANLSGMAHEVRVNDGLSGSNSVNVFYNTRLKRHCDMEGEDVDIVGGRLLTFGMCNLNANRVAQRSEDGTPARVEDGKSHLMGVTMQFVNGQDSTFVFDVTEQVQTRYKGGVLTIELDVKEIPMPMGRPDSGFDASVEDMEDGGTHEIPL